MVVRFVVLGRTAGLRSSRRIIGRYKSEEELRDVFEVSRLNRHARRLLVFRVVEPGDDAWHLVSFDIRGVVGRRSGRVRRATKEYSVIKQGMFWSLCGRIDNSTYICPCDTSDIPRRYTDRVETWTVVPHDPKTLEEVRSSVESTVMWLALIMNRAGGRLHARGVARARNLLRLSETLLSAPWAKKVERTLGVPLKPIRDARERLAEALERKRGRGTLSGGSRVL